MTGAGVSDKVTAQTTAAVRRPTRAPLLLGIVFLGLVAAGFALGVHQANLHNGLIAPAFTMVGLYVVTQRPGNREGWLFIATGGAHAAMFFAREYGLHEGDALPGQAWVGWAGVWPLALVLALFGFTLMCFPDGRLPSPRWRWAVAAMVVAGAGLALASALWPVEYSRISLAEPHPLDVPGAALAERVWTPVGRTSYLLFQVAWMACVVVRMRRAEGDERVQLKWFVYAVTMGVAAMVLGLVVLQSPALGLLAVPFVPVAAGLAIVKHRLYDIDLVISKSLVIGAMAALVTVCYIGVVLGVGGLVGASTGAGSASALVATAIVAVLFEPARRRVQRGADRLVFGRRPTPYEALARLSIQLSLDTPGTDLFAGLASTVADGVGAREVTLWVGSDDHLVAVASWPPGQGIETPLAATLGELGSMVGGRSHVRPILHNSRLRGAITLTKAPGDALTGADDRLLTDLVAQAGLVIDHAGLSAELQERLRQISVQAGELRAAAKRIVVAQDDARRRIERDLHDGAQQRLVMLALSLRDVADRAASAGEADLASRIEATRRELSDALAELREMARGIHPAVLTQDGLEAALGFLAERSPVPVQVRVRLDRRLARDVEAAAYFVVSEALTNAARHSAGSRVVVDGGIDDGVLRIEVSDDGRGGADGNWGSGLQGLADRLATLNGHIDVESPTGHGTRIRAVIPCG